MKGDSEIPKGMSLIRDPGRNRGLGFSDKERNTFGLRGLLPAAVFSLKQQAELASKQLDELPTDLLKYKFLRELQETDEELFYHLIIQEITKLLPLIYTPTVGAACKNYSRLFTRPRGLFITLKDRHSVKEILENWPVREVRVIVVTDGERILGLGDQGAQGMGIPVGKLSLYTGCGGIKPEECLPVTLDVGTNNKDLLSNDMYIGVREKREKGAAYDELVEEFVEGAVQVFGEQTLIQFEDFGNENAFRLLEKYRNKVCCFNDDIQGTGAVALAGIQAVMRHTSQSLRDQVYMFLGAGSAAVGIADTIALAMHMWEDVGEEEAKRKIWLVDSQGLVVKSRKDLAEHKKSYAHDHDSLDFAAAVKQLKPTVLIGVSGQGNAFTEEICKQMRQNSEHPIIFALSNPTDQTEVTPDDCYKWTEGAAFYASGSPFDPSEVGGKKKVSRQCNNSYIFPGVGLGVRLSGAKHVVNEMFLAAADALSRSVNDKQIDAGSLYPDLEKVRSVSAAIASSVIKVAIEKKLARIDDAEPTEQYVTAHMYDPVKTEKEEQKE